MEFPTIPLSFEWIQLQSDSLRDDLFFPSQRFPPFLLLLSEIYTINTLSKWNQSTVIDGLASTCVELIRLCEGTFIHTHLLQFQSMAWTPQRLELLLSHSSSLSSYQSLLLCTILRLLYQSSSSSSVYTSIPHHTILQFLLQLLQTASNSLSNQMNKALWLLLRDLAPKQLPSNVVVFYSELYVA